VNKRGHTAQETLEATALLRAGGFKMVLHWMPNLLGATPASDREDFSRMWGDGAYCPDEIKIYPCQLLEGTELYQRWQQGEYQPYSEATLLDLIADIKTTVPRYCRINRIIRDIPSTYVVAGNKNTSLRQDIQQEMKRRGTRCECIRCREIRKKQVSAENLAYHDLVYHPAMPRSIFSPTTRPMIIWRVSCAYPFRGDHLSGMEDLAEAAIIREVHVYGQSLELG
jgi:elongator complex protein 3